MISFPPLSMRMGLLVCAAGLSLLAWQSVFASADRYREIGESSDRLAQLTAGRATGAGLEQRRTQFEEMLNGPTPLVSSKISDAERHLNAVVRRAAGQGKIVSFRQELAVLIDGASGIRATATVHMPAGEAISFIQSISQSRPAVAVERLRLERQKPAAAADGELIVISATLRSYALEAPSQVAGPKK